MTVHDFKSSLAWSKAQEDAPWWDDVYQAAFPDLCAAVSVRNDGWAQRGGIDRVLTLASGKTLYVDEKVREKDWPDVLLEVWSDYGARKSDPERARGWLVKPLATDFIAYAFVPSQKCLLLPFQTLRATWRQNGQCWADKAKERRDGFRWVDADNGRYTTRSIAVPTVVLMSAMADAMSVCWGAA
jgi:hypothetical protein